MLSKKILLGPKNILSILARQCGSFVGSTLAVCWRRAIEVGHRRMFSTLFYGSPQPSNKYLGWTVKQCM